MHKKKEFNISPSLAAAIAAVGLLAGIGLGWILFARSGQGMANLPTGGMPAATNESATSPETVSFSGIIIGVGSDRLVVYMSQGPVAGINVTLFVNSDTVLQKVVAKTDQELAAETGYAENIKDWDYSKGLPPPLDPVENPYKTQTIKIGDLAVDDVADFTAVGDPASGQMTAKSVTWTWHMDRAQPVLNK